MIVTAEPLDAREWTVATSVTKRVALVPTMGALHEGHLSLVRRGMEIADEVAVSIFVNPTQFGPAEDLSQYPRPLEEDLAALRAAGVAMVFTPTSDAIYPPGFSTYIEPPAVSATLEGLIRPGHFRGVCTVVLKLFQIIPATFAVFGQKDYQQSLVVSAMVRDLEVPISLDIVETVREPDGLAMSSRNRYLDANQRSRSLRLSQALTAAKELFRGGERQCIRLEAAMLDALRFGQPDGVDKVDYAVVVEADSLQPITEIEDRAVALVAARIGKTRLIDNVVLR
ncbi:MAG: pantoate--beta-alanine ligase [Planctomycetaceae bacterium]